jgi:hypothetical protein
MKANNIKLSLPLAVLITLVAIIYQRTTGPTYPKKVKISHSAGNVTLRLLRSYGGAGDAPIVLPLSNEKFSAKMFYRRFPTKDKWSQKDFKNTDGVLSVDLPHQPPAGKIQYYIELNEKGNKEFKIALREDPIIIRFKGDVPVWVLGPHIFFMFIAMFCSSWTFFEAFSSTVLTRKLTFITTGCLAFGGMVLGPIVQKFAFGVYWAGFPFGYDLTDNKLLIMAIFWLAATVMNLKKTHKWTPILAGLILIAMYAIPHSTMGSQYNYEAQKVETDVD